MEELKAQEDSIETAESLNTEAWVNRRTDVNKTFSLATEALHISRKIEFEKGTADALRSLGYCYWQFSDYPQALEHSMEALRIYELIGNAGGQANTVSSIGAVYAFMGDDENRLKYNLYCLDLRKKTNDREGELTTLNNIGDTYMKLRQYDKALEYFFLCLEESDDFAHNRAIVLLNIGEVYFLLGDYSKSRSFLEQSKSVSEKNNFIRFVIAADLLTGQVLIKEGKYQEAITVLQNALHDSKKIENNEYVYEAYKSLSDAFEGSGNISEAFNCFKDFHSLREKVLNEDITGKLRNIQLHYKVQSAQKEVEMERIKNRELNEANQEIEKQKNEILEKNKQITDSIRYAKRIQEAILPATGEFRRILKESFVYYQPKDIVSGDFYWLDKRQDKIVVAAVDCTGHGVPGAFMSIIGHNLLNQVVREQGITKPPEILDHLNIGVAGMLKNETADLAVRDGMDISICRIDFNEMELIFSGANNPLYLVRNKSLEEFKGDKKPIGNFPGGGYKPFSSQTISLEKEDMIYLMTDGYADQFGGSKGKKFKYRHLKELLASVSCKPVDDQKQILEHTMEKWKKDFEQVDDMLVIGIRI